MATMKEIATKLIEAIPQECPDCGRDLTGLAQWDVLNGLVDLLLTRIEQAKGGADGEQWLRTGYRIGYQDAKKGEPNALNMERENGLRPGGDECQAPQGG